MLPILAAAQAIGTVDKLATGLSSAWKSLQADSSKPSSPSFSDMLADAGGGDIAAPAAKGKAGHVGHGQDATPHRPLNRVA